MTTEEKALALVNEVLDSRADDIDDFSPGELRLALLAAIEAHEADNARNEQRLADQAKAFSDAAKEALQGLGDGRFLDIPGARKAISPFILPEPEPDPLVELMAFNGLDEALAEQRATNLRKDAADLGYKIIVERIEQ